MDQVWKFTKREHIKFAKRLKEARLEASLTQTEVAKILGKHQTHKSKLEIGKIKVMFHEFIILCEIYNKTPSFFLSAYRIK